MTFQEFTDRMSEDEKREFIDLIRTGRLIWCEGLEELELALDIIQKRKEMH